MTSWKATRQQSKWRQGPGASALWLLSLVSTEPVSFYFFMFFFLQLFTRGKLKLYFQKCTLDRTRFEAKRWRSSLFVRVVLCAIISSLVSTEPVNFSERLFWLACKLVGLNVTFYKFKHQILNIGVNKRSAWTHQERWVFEYLIIFCHRWLSQQRGNSFVTIHNDQILAQIHTKCWPVNQVDRLPAKLSSAVCHSQHITTIVPKLANWPWVTLWKHCRTFCTWKIVKLCSSEGIFQ